MDELLFPSGNQVVILSSAPVEQAAPELITTETYRDNENYNDIMQLFPVSGVTLCATLQ
jgi:hypothetical protein